MKHSTTAFVLSLYIIFSLARADSCRNCTINQQCDEGFYCCNNECAPLPALGEACPCQQCPSGLACINGICTYNGLNCSCTTSSDCTSGTYQGLSPACIANRCELVSTSPPFSYFTPGGACDSLCWSNYCNADNKCDYNPLGTTCTYSYYCAPGSGCFGDSGGKTCQLLKSVGEACSYEGQCPTNYVCRKSSSSSAAVCKKKGEVGEYCESQDQCNGIDCVDNTCSYPARGEQCFYDTCSPADVCHVNYTCIAQNSLPNGESCTRSNACQSNICNGICLATSSIGGFCNVTEQCPNGQCLNNKCFGISFPGEKCNATHACYSSWNRPCRDGVCPQYYSAIGEYCASDSECAVGFCTNGVCDYPTTCNATAYCGRNLICDCGECKFMPDNFMTSSHYYMYYLYYLGGFYQLLARSPERDCLKNRVVNSQCESIIARYYCYQYCYSIGSFPNAGASDVNVDCATLKVLSLNATRQPCCSATSQTDCADGITNCRIFNENNIKPFITRPSVPTAPVSAPTSTSPPSSTPPNSAPLSTPNVSAPQSAPTASTPQATPTTVPQTPTAVPLAAPISSAPISATPLAAPTSPDTCNCAAPTSLCDQELRVCVGLRVTPIVQCVEYSNNQYTAYMAYLNDQPINVTLGNDVNFLNVNVQNKVTLFTTGRPFTYPQSAFNVITNSAQQVTWYLDGFKLNFDIAAEDLRCPQDVTFQMTSSATVEQLIAISDSLIGNLSDVMQIARSRLNVTFSASAKRQSSSSVITVVVKADQTSADSSSQVVLDFVQTGFATFTSRVPTAAVASVTTVPPANEQSGSQAVTPPTNNPVALNAPRDRTVVSNSTRVLVNVALLLVVSFLF